MSGAGQLHAAAINPTKPFRRKQKLKALPIVASLALSPCAAFQHNGMPRTQRHESHHEIFQLEEALRNAVLKADISALDSLWLTDYMAITPNGTLQSKEQALANLRSGATHFTAVEISDRRVRFYGTTALVTSRADYASSAHEFVVFRGWNRTRLNRDENSQDFRHIRGRPRLSLKLPKEPSLGGSDGSRGLASPCRQEPKAPA